VAGVLLLHGMSDSPYSLHTIGKVLHENGAWVTGLRLPGHGTIPSGLTDFRWEDMAAAVRLAMKHLKDQVGDKPLYIIGYSNGGALAVNYALETVQGADQPRASRIVLISPAIGVSPATAFAVWQARLGHLLGLEKLEWTDILPEYDPYKYNSFAVNAGDQVHRLTSRIRDAIEALGATGKLAELPPILAFQSVADATVSVSAVVETLFSKLPQGGHELVMFDINRRQALQPLIGNDEGPRVESLLAQAAPTFTLSFLTIENATSRRMLLVQRRPEDAQLQRYPLGLDWPRGVFSLAHVALPFAPDDPLYGTEAPRQPDTLFLGNIAMRGENGVLQLTPAAMLRLRWNPFYDYLEGQTLDFLGFTRASEAVPADGTEGTEGTAEETGNP
jgi:alpha-beta hydrolase superfamily lysophospholipase